MTYSFSLSYARRIFGGQVVEAAYVGTRGADLVSRRDGNAIPLERHPVHGHRRQCRPVATRSIARRSTTTVINRYRPFQAYSGVTF